jgi:hypothetical protein
MAKDIDEDLIEATIRRVAESKAAREGSPTETDAASLDAVDGDSNEDEREDDSRLEDGGATAGTLTAHASEREQGGARAVTPLAAAMSTTPDRTDEDEASARDRIIEATIRRVAESKAAREGAPIEMPVAESIAPEIEAAKPRIDEPTVPPETEDASFDLDTQDDDELAVIPTPLNAAARGRGFPRPATSLAAAMSTTPDYIAADEAAPREWPLVRARPAPAPAAEPPVLIDADVHRQLREITQRLDHITVLIESLAGNAREPEIGPAWAQAQASTRAATVTRPAIFRDDGTRPPVHEPQPEIIDTRPIPEPLPPLQVEPRRGFDLLPRSYRITVEDKRRGVDLVPLHRALLGMEGVRDMSLLSYNNGVAIVALETTEELEPDALGDSVSRAMSRGAKVEVHNEHTMVVKLADE